MVGANRGSVPNVENMRVDEAAKEARRMGLRDKALRTFFVEEAKLGLNAGISFGREGSGFMRLNFALSRAKMSKIIELLEYALENRFGRVKWYR